MNTTDIFSRTGEIVVDQNDVDALLGSLEGDDSQGKKSSKEESHIQQLGERSGGFKIDPRESHFTGTDSLRSRAESLSINPEDFTDQLGKENDRKQRKRLLIGFGIALFLLILGGMSYMLIQSLTAQATATTPIDHTEEQRFLNLFPDAPAPDTSTATHLVATETGLRIVDGYTLTFAGMEFETLDYQATAANDYGPAAIATVEGDWNGTTVYLFKDMAHSRAFASAWDGAETTVEGSPASAVMLMELSSGVHAVLAIVNPDSTGFMIVLPKNLNYASAENLQNFVRIENIPASIDTSVTDEEATSVSANFEEQCSPRYNTELSTILGQVTVSDSRIVNAVYLTSENGEGVLVGVKNSQGDTGEFVYMREYAYWFPANQETYDELSNFLISSGVFSSVSAEEEQYVTDFYEEFSQIPLYQTFNECLTLLETP